MNLRRARTTTPPLAFGELRHAVVVGKKAEHLVRRDELIETLWPDTYVTDANLTNVIVSLRKTLGRDAIQTVSKFGYRFCLPVLGEPGPSGNLELSEATLRRALASVRTSPAPTTSTRSCRLIWASPRTLSCG